MREDSPSTRPLSGPRCCFPVQATALRTSIPDEERLSHTGSSVRPRAGCYSLNGAPAGAAWLSSRDMAHLLDAVARTVGADQMPGSGLLVGPHLPDGANSRSVRAAQHAVRLSARELCRARLVGIGRRLPP